MTDKEKIEYLEDLVANAGTDSGLYYCSASGCLWCEQYSTWTGNERKQNHHDGCPVFTKDGEIKYVSME